MSEDVYADFIAEVLTGDFAAPPAGEWGAARIAAHVGRNQEELITTTERILTGDFASYDNRNTTGEMELDRYIEAYHSLAGLADRIAQTSVALREVAARLLERQGESQGEQPVSIPVFIQDGDRVVVDAPTPWHEILKLDEKTHVRMHLAQLRALDRRLRTAPAAPSNPAPLNGATPHPAAPKPGPPKPGPPRSAPRKPA